MRAFRVALLRGLGYEAGILQALSMQTRNTLFTLVWAVPVSCALAAWGVGYALYTVFSSKAIGLVASLLVGMFVWNLFRILLVGGGPPFNTPRDSFSPGSAKFVPLLIFIFLGVLWAQPVLTLLDSGRIEPALQAHALSLGEEAWSGRRSQLMEELEVRSYRLKRAASKLEANDLHQAQQRLAKVTHRKQLLGKSPAGVQEADSIQMKADLASQEISNIKEQLTTIQEEIGAIALEGDQIKHKFIQSYLVDTDSRGFLAFRIRERWKHPASTLLGTLVIALLSALPLVLTRTAQQEYGLLYWDTHQPHVLALLSHTQDVVERQLRSQPSYSSKGSVPFADSPWNTTRAVPPPVETEVIKNEDLLKLLPRGPQA